MKAGSWASILGIYLFGVCGASTVSKIIPLATDIGGTFGLPPANFGWLVALIALPAALFAIPSGIVVDRLGARLVLILGAALAVLANLIYVLAPTLTLVQFARLLEGFAVVHIYTAGPAMLMVTTGGDRRTRSMTLWSTYAPVGTALGLAMGGLFAEGDGWRSTFIAHGLLFALAGLLAFLQPKVATADPAKVTSLGERLADLGRAFMRPMLVLLAFAFFLIISLGLGASVTFPLFLAGAHEIPVQESSSIVAATTLAMILGSFGVGYLLPKGIRPALLFSLVAAGGLVAGALCFFPQLAILPRYGALIGWFILTGAALAAVLAMLPLVAEPGRQGSAAAMINFAGAVATFLNPPLWLAVLGSGEWTPFLGLLAVGWLLAVLAVLASMLLVGRTQDREPR